jgi:hypothetical protein
MRATTVPLMVPVRFGRRCGDISSHLTDGMYMKVDGIAGAGGTGVGDIFRGWIYGEEDASVGRDPPSY